MLCNSLALFARSTNVMDHKPCKICSVRNSCSNYTFNVSCRCSSKYRVKQRVRKLLAVQDSFKRVAIMSNYAVLYNKM